MIVDPPLVRAARRDGVRDERVLDAFARVAREGFVPPGMEPEASIDAPIPIGRGQVTTQPSLIARMVEALELRGSERVLEVGTGYGYQTAILAELASEVVSIDRLRDIADQASANLRAASYGPDRVHVIVGDGTMGVADRAPFDAIVVAAAAPAVPRPLAAQLAEGGRLVQPIGSGGSEQVFAFRKSSGRLVRGDLICHAFFVPLVGRHGVAG